MISKVWAGLILLSCVLTVLGHVFFDQAGPSVWVDELFRMSDLSVDLALGLIGALCFWMGMFQIAQASGVVSGLGHLLEPLLLKLMPSIPPGHPVLGSITMNIAANVFGLDNAATPMGLKAMEELQSLNGESKTLSDPQLLFVVLNTSSVTLLPVTILMYRAQLGAANPADVLLPIIVATTCSTCVGVGFVAWRQKCLEWSPRLLLSVLCYVGVLVSLIVFASGSQSQFSQIGPSILLATVGGILAWGLYRQVPVYEEFITGAKQGFDIAVKIIPYLVAMLVAIGVLRASGAIDAVLWCVIWVCQQIGVGTDFVGALPTAFMKPFSGSGARALMIETMNNYGVDSLQGRMAAVMQGSTETTFYVLSVYLGVVGIQKSRYLISACLLADVAGCVAAIAITQLFFGV